MCRCGPNEIRNNHGFDRLFSSVFFDAWTVKPTTSPAVVNDLLHARTRGRSPFRVRPSRIPSQSRCGSRAQYGYSPARDRRRTDVATTRVKASGAKRDARRRKVSKCFLRAHTRARIRFPVSVPEDRIETCTLFRKFIPRTRSVWATYASG